MIIIEGPRNSGKKTLASTLALQFDLPIYDYNHQLKADGYVKINEIEKDLRSWSDKKVGIYITHPLISEYIYGPLSRKKGIPEFYSANVRPILRYLIDSSVIIYCRPDFTDDALPFFDLLFRTPLTSFRVWEYSYTIDPHITNLINPVNDYIINARLTRHHKKIGSRFHGRTTL